ncbi:hypothetical protein [Faecalibacter bovis]|uniref:Organic solvent tolerance-like N-terminal domain-containing protein n=1 Tax=Faecalibacter bovis TaxID=2898187 RepID=A0ABX7XD85_9FLAO|nr:hypothetical protein [Faecalibacter bovis]QTV05881.1 hypothetical protein J9309_00590 [Faecalibacter bovis]
MIKNILYFNCTNSYRINFFYLVVIIFSSIINYIHAQEFKLDTLVQSTEDISINDTTFITIKDSTMVYVTKGTVLVNFIEKTENSKNIVFIDKKEVTEDKILLKDNASEIKIASNTTVNKTLKKDNLISYTKIKERSKITIPPFTQLFYFSSAPNKISTNNNNTPVFRAIINKNLEIKYNADVEILYRTSYYNYICSSLCVSISTLDIRSPSQLI